MACGGSKEPKSQAPKSDVLDAKTRAALAPLDATLIAALERGDIKLIRTVPLLKLTKLTYRQALEANDPSIFMPPAEAAALLRAGTRELGALTYGWCSGADPDTEGEYLRAVQAALRTRLSALTQLPAAQVAASEDLQVRIHTSSLTPASVDTSSLHTSSLHTDLHTL